MISPVTKEPQCMTPIDPENTRLEAENAELRHKVASLERRLSIQPQTGLPTHFRLETELDELIGSFRKAGDRRGFSVLIVQLCAGYDSIRKSLKASVSEWILYQTGCRIAGILRPEDSLFHTHETEFVLVLPGRKGRTLEDFMRRLLGLLSEPHIFAGLNLSVRVSTGAAYWPEHGEDRSEILHCADIAVGAAVEERNPFVVFRPRLFEKAVDKIELQSAIIRGIEASAMERIGEQFFIAYQPKLFANGLEGNKLRVERVEAEALIRWRHPTKGLIMPSAFIPLAEETGLILPLGKWIIYQCTRKLAAWKREGLGDIGISVNLSARQFMSGEAVDTIAAALCDSGIDPKALTIEVTETSIFEEPERAEAEIAKLASLGLKISMDDFGTGYSSLSHLHRFSLDEIKIDRLFIEQLDSKREDRIIVGSLVSIARGLELELVAEGVERPEALKILWDMGCRGFQGYLFSRPLSDEGFIKFRRRIQDAGMTFTF